MIRPDPATQKKKQENPLLAVIRSDQIQRYISPFCWASEKIVSNFPELFCVVVGLAHCVTDALGLFSKKKKVRGDCLAANYSERILVHIFRSQKNAKKAIHLIFSAKGLLLIGH